HRVPRARDRRPAVPAVVPAEERVLQAGAKPVADAESHPGRAGGGEHAKPSSVATARAGGQADPDVDLARVRRDFANGLGALAAPLPARGEVGWGRQQSLVPFGESTGSW